MKRFATIFIFVFQLLGGSLWAQSDSVNVRIPQNRLGLSGVVDALRNAGREVAYSKEALKGAGYFYFDRGSYSLQEIQEILEASGKVICFEENGTLLLLPNPKNKTAKADLRTLNGYVRETGSGENLPGVTVLLPDAGTGTATNGYGFFSLRIPKHGARVVFSAIGFAPLDTVLVANAGNPVEIRLSPDLVALDAVVVKASNKAPLSSDTPYSGRINLPVEQVRDLPSFMGEKDVFKTLQLMPGVQSGQEGNSGLYVRGGGADQNLIILDDAPVYNASHLFGFFSVFNGDALKSVTLHKSGFPARFGGRLSSVLKMDMKEGDRERFRARGAIGVLTSSLTVEGPLEKGKSSFLASGRRSFLDLALRPFTEDKATPYFYDVNLKFNRSFGPKDRLYASGYFGNDHFYFKQSSGHLLIGWGNRTGTLRWNHQFSDRLFVNTSAIYSDFKFNIDYERKYDRVDEDDYRFEYTSTISDLTLKSDFDYRLSNAHQLRSGISASRRRFRPNIIDINNGENGSYRQHVPKEYSMEYNAYLEDEMRLGKYIQANFGARISAFEANDKNYTSWEPRLAFSLKTGSNSAIKASYSKMTQYLHLLSTTGIGLPTDLWVPSTDKIKPATSWQTATGWVKDFPDHGLEFTAETYYKETNGLVLYRDGANLLDLSQATDIDVRSVDFDWSDKITQGKGTSYGAEFLLRKTTGKVTGWIGYTIAKASVKAPDNNQGKSYAPRHDRRHDLAVVGIYKPSKKRTFSFSWTYGSGTPYTISSGRGVSLNYPEPNRTNHFQDLFGEKSNFRGEAQHRLDVSVQFHKDKRWGRRTWELGVYNLYNRKNPYFYYTNTDSSPDSEVTKTSFRKVTLFPILPYFSYKFIIG
ncbi:TonB-dependent receptor (plasmid) [Fulvitalea axinellae]|uniref:TonB-dependent receptor n=1 Tax=Fulvitalea axinellae TaxID=1182444 RepID=A0AAU9CIQ0_9BACT|nr:TonB-dependent receptor [Fulvitalea axinellae]